MLYKNDYNCKIFWYNCKFCTKSFRVIKNSWNRCSKMQKNNENYNFKKPEEFRTL